MDTKLGVALIAGLGLAYYLGMPDKTPSSPERTESRSMQLQAVDVSKREAAAPVTDIKSIQKQRELYRDQLALGIVSMRPPMNKNKWAFALDYAPIERRCVNGDIDLIQRHVPSDQTLLWTWEAQGAPTPLISRKVAVKELSKPFTQALELPADSTARYYRLSLCLQPQGGSCAQLPAVDYRTLEKRDRKINLKSGLFFTQYFRVDDTGIQIFDSSVVKNVEAYKKFAVKVDGNAGADPFLDEMVKQQKTLGSLPVDVKKDKVDIHLYVRKDKGC